VIMDELIADALVDRLHNVAEIRETSRRDPLSPVWSSLMNWSRMLSLPCVTPSASRARDPGV